MAVRIKEEVPLGVSDESCASSRRVALSNASTEAISPLECAYEGRIGGFLSDTSRLCLRISSDGTLLGEVWRKRPTAASGSTGGIAADGGDGAKRRRVEVATAVKSEGDVPPTAEGGDAVVVNGVWPGNDHVLIAHVAGGAAYEKVDGGVSCSGKQGAVSGDGALKQDPGVVESTGSTGNRTGKFEYCCWFDVTKRANHIDRHTVRCHMHIRAAEAVGKLLTADVADGQWSLPFQRQARSSAGIPSKDLMTSGSNDNTALSPSLAKQPKPEDQLFKLVQIDPNAEYSIVDADMAAGRPSRLYPLRPGKYDFQGFTTYKTPVVSPTPRRRGHRRRSSAPPAITKDECIVSLRLFPDGTLRGTSRELVHPQVCTVYGNWQVNRVIYILEYRVRDAVGRFRYSGGVDANGERDKLVGKWRNVDEGHADGYEGGKGEFELGLVRVRYDADVGGNYKREKKQDPATKSEPPIDQAVATVTIAPVVKPEEHKGIEVKTDIIADDEEEDLAIKALTSGHYKLKGEATDSDGYEYAFELIMTLYPGGQLVGASRERIFEQTRPVTGRWNRLGIAYDQAYVVCREVGIYLYAGQLSPDGVVIRGEWRNAEEQYASIRSEHGTFALAITSAERFWSTDSHRDFPRGFCEAVRCLLLCSARSHVLPGALWTHILAFCDEKWFAPCDDENVKSVDDALKYNPEVLV